MARTATEERDSIMNEDNRTQAADCVIDWLIERAYRIYNTRIEPNSIRDSSSKKGGPSRPGPPVQGANRGQSDVVPVAFSLAIIVLSIVFVGGNIVDQYPDTFCEDEFGEEPADAAVLENGSIECEYEDRTVYTDEEFKNITSVAASLTGVD